MKPDLSRAVLGRGSVAARVGAAARAIGPRNFLVVSLIVTLLIAVVPGSAGPARRVSFIARRVFEVPGFPTSVAVEDFNGDANLDLAVASGGANNVSVLLGNGDGSFQAAVHFGAGVVSRSVTVGDFNGDAKPDLAVANYLSNNVSVLINNTGP